MNKIIRIGCDTTWANIPATADPSSRLSIRDQLQVWFPIRPRPVPLTPRACLWVANTRPLVVNALASALLGFLHLPIQQLTGPAYLTGSRHGNPAPLTSTEHQAFTTSLRTVAGMPDYLALHTQAGQLAAAWLRPAPERAQP